jgi:hypothetical protein
MWTSQRTAPGQPRPSQPSFDCQLSYRSAAEPRAPDRMIANRRVIGTFASLNIRRLSANCGSGAGGRLKLEGQTPLAAMAHGRAVQGRQGGLLLASAKFADCCQDSCQITNSRLRVPEKYQITHCFYWWARQDSNLQPSGYEPLALTIELRARYARRARRR